MRTALRRGFRPQLKITATLQHPTSECVVEGAEPLRAHPDRAFAAAAQRRRGARRCAASNPQPSLPRAHHHRAAHQIVSAAASHRRRPRLLVAAPRAPRRPAPTTAGAPLANHRPLDSLSPTREAREADPRLWRQWTTTRPPSSRGQRVPHSAVSARRPSHYPRFLRHSARIVLVISSVRSASSAANAGGPATAGATQHAPLGAAAHWIHWMGAPFSTVRPPRRSIAPGRARPFAAEVC